MPGTQKLTQEQIDARVAEKGITAEEAQSELETEVRTELEERALAEGKTVEELLAEDEELSGIIEKYGGDPTKIARAYKSSQQEISKAIERQKTLEREKQETEQRLTQATFGQPGSKKDPREAIRENMKKKYPTLDDDVIEAIVDQQVDTAQALRMEYLIDKANDRLSIEKEALKDDPRYKKYKEEIDKLIDAQPLQAKLSPGMAQRCRDLVIGQHVDEIEKEAKGEGSPGSSEIVGQVKGPKSSASTIGKPREGSLTAPQAKQAGEMGLKPESYLAILKKHKDQAKKDSLPEPQLLTDSWHKKT